MSERQALRTKALLARLTNMTEVEAQFPGGRVTVGIGPREATTVQGQLMLSFAVNLLARLFPVVRKLTVLVPDAPLATRVPRWSAPTLRRHLNLLLTELSPPVHWNVVEGPHEEGTCSLWLGEPSLVVAPTCFIGSEDWYVYVSPNEPQPVRGHNPVGAYAAACFGVAEIFKKLILNTQELFDGIPIVPLDRWLAFSTFSYRARSAELNPSLPDRIDLGRLTAVGLGAGGGAAAFTLATLPTLSGILNLIEPDEIEEPNLNRYVFATAKDAFQRLPKSAVVGQLFNGTPIEVRPFANTFGDARPTLTAADLEHVVAAVHSREARRALQFDTPRVLWDAGATQDGEFRIWRLILGQTECMFCKHPVSQDDPERRKAEQLARLFGISADVWLSKLRDNDQFTEEEVRCVGQRFMGGAEIYLPRVGQRFGDWEAEQCGKLKLPKVDEEIPLPFAPVLAGVLIAGEIIKERYFADQILDSYYWNTLLGNFMVRNEPRRRLPRSDCTFCRDQDYLGQYRRRWGLKAERGLE